LLYYIFFGNISLHVFYTLSLHDALPIFSPWVMPDILHNAHCRYRMWRLHEPMPFLVRNADGDELLFIHEGSGDFYCDYGHLTLRDRKSTRLNSSHVKISYAVFCLKKKNY